MAAAYREADAYKTGADPDNFVGLFNPQMREMPDGTRRLFGEDYSFCLRWLDLGGQIYADTKLRFRHIGMKEYSGCFADHLARKAPVAVRDDRGEPGR
ncbi:hypothetical protein [Mesorhizobium helmanticense]|uniref:Uncharacterized protein n=1 Tax=Mesorhizobium helmanticense TaxID=1776423 RepID=A0A2T4IP28_9HYPH|nr:hypothetical protein [Mesorhizobium helmanticense]PTE07392.1 hypothetical protein C9427_27215 [Mesorhizobium helmanticense]